MYLSIHRQNLQCLLLCKPSRAEVYDTRVRQGRNFVFIGKSPDLPESRLCFKRAFVELVLDQCSLHVLTILPVRATVLQLTNLTEVKAVAKLSTRIVMFDYDSSSKTIAGGRTQYCSTLRKVMVNRKIVDSRAFSFTELSTSLTFSIQQCL